MSGAKRQKKEEKAMHAALSAASNGFTVDLYKALPQQNPLNDVVLSGLSLHRVLGMLAMGAEGETWTQIMEGIRFAANQTGEGGAGDANVDLGRRYNAIMKSLKVKATGSKSLTILMANRLYVHANSQFQPHPNFVSALRENFQSDVEKMDLSTPEKREQALARINSWVKAETKKNIESIIDKPLDKDTRLVLVSALYFLGMWETRFMPTGISGFSVNASKLVAAHFMASTMDYLYADLQDLNAQAVAIPYRGNRMSMIIILPKEVDDLEKMTDSLEGLVQGNNGGKSMIMSRMKTELVRIRMPLFKIESNHQDLAENLKTLGMKNMFSWPDANFGGMQSPVDSKGKPLPKEPLYVSQVVQKVFINVTEEGTVAAAATGAEVRAGNPSTPKPKIFDVYHPFYFQIVDHENQDLILFSGHVVEPKSNMAIL